MLVYTYITPDGLTKSINIELLNTDFVNYWKDYFVSIIAKVPQINFFGSGINYNSKHLEPKDLIVPLLQLRKSFSYFENLELEDFTDVILEIEQLAVNPDQIRQHHVNKWHRLFTTLEGKYLSIPKKFFTDVTKFDELWNYVQNINLYSHAMEGHTYPLLERRKKYENKEQISLLHTTAYTVELAPDVFSVENIRWIKGWSFDFLNEEYHHTVWLHEEITGKDQMKAWLDHDDLTEFDITGNKLMTPSITLDPDMIYPGILDNEEFRKESISSGKKLDRYPLGNIVNIEEISNWEEIRFSKIISIDLDNKRIWSDNA